MTMQLLVATDLSKGSVPAALWAFRYARRLDTTDVEVTLAHAVHSRYPQIVDTGTRLDDPENRRQLANEIDDWLERNVPREDIPYSIEILEGRPRDVLPDLVEDVDADWLATGVTGRGALSKLVVGSTSETLAHNPPCNMAICHPKGIDWEEEPTIAVGVDFTDASARATRKAAEFARQIGASLHVLHVVAPPTYESYPFEGLEMGDVDDMSSLIERMRTELNHFLEDYESVLEGVDWHRHVLSGYPTEEITSFADREDVDGLFLGTAGRSAMADFVVGSVERGLVKHAPCSLFLTPPA
jgi:nucleotide-binding universal stress UspA family protein